ncbi:MAG TPA: acyltransferase [Caulobacteraceae bacterium]
MSLDGLRGIAALAIMFLHTSEFTLGRTLTSAGRAVDFFFLLSGFVLSAAYVAPGARYVRARVIRLYPMVLFGVALGASLMLSTGLAGPWRTALALNLIGLPFPGISYAFDVPLWSIAIEAELSVVFILLARMRIPYLVIVLGCAAVAASLLQTPNPPEEFARGLLPFVTGILVHRLVKKSSGSKSLPIAAMLLLVCLLCIPEIQKVSVLRTAAFTVVLLAGISDPPSFARPACDYLGRLSYPLYAIHWPLGWWAARHGIVGPWGFVATCAAAVCLAHVAMVLYDEPVRSALSVRFARLKPA